MTPPKITPPSAAKLDPATTVGTDAGALIPARFEDAVSELEQIVAAMESGLLPLEESLAAFQRGTELLRHCRGALESAEQRIRVLQDGELTDLPPDSARNE